MTDTSEAIAAMLDANDPKDLWNLRRNQRAQFLPKFPYFKEVYKINLTFKVWF